MPLKALIAATGLHGGGDDFARTSDLVAHHGAADMFGPGSKLQPELLFEEAPNFKVPMVQTVSQCVNQK